MYDVIVVGAGPTGSHIASRLAQWGYKVAVLERKQTIGGKVCCSGIISRECHESFRLSNDIVLREASSAKFFVPSGRYLRLKKDTVQAYVVDRSAFDIALARRAQEAGAEYFLRAMVTDVLPAKDGCQVEADCLGKKQVFQARAVVIACGFGSNLPEHLGMGTIADFIFGAQTEVNTQLDEVEIYFDQKVAPGGFAWLIPTSNGRGLVGLLSRRNAYPLLEGLLSKFIAEGKIRPTEFKIRQKVLPLGTLRRTYGNRVLVAGEAAGQVKATTGGGIYFGLLCADLAVNTLRRAFLADDLSPRQLSAYQREWQRKIGPDLRIGNAARRLYDKISQTQMERLFDIIKTCKIDEQMLEREDFFFDFHGRLILKVLRQPKLLFALATPKLLFPIGGIAALWLNLKNESGLGRSYRS